MSFSQCVLTTPSVGSDDDKIVCSILGEQYENGLTFLENETQ